jgi:plasmid maintenance system antidote protein VapI
MDNKYTKIDFNMCPEQYIIKDFFATSLNDLLCQPCETLKEIMEYYKMDKYTLAKKMNITICDAQELMKGGIWTIETCGKLTKVFNIPKSFWINLQQKYFFDIEQTLKQYNLL